MKNDRIPLTEEQKQEKRVVDAFLVLLSLFMTMAVIGEVLLLVPFYSWFQNVRGF